MESRKRVQLREDKLKASFDYILADLIGHSIARLRGKHNLPSINKVYPTLFGNEEIETSKDEISAIRFRAFADKFNKKYKGV